MDDLLNEFLTETNENIDVVDSELVKLEQDPNNKEVLNNIFRLVHTIKGTCGFLGLPRLEAVAHASENVLGKFRDGEVEVTADAVTLVLESLDQIKVILGAIEATEVEPEGEDADLIARLNAAAAGELAAGAAKPDVEEKDPRQAELDELEAAFLAAPGPDDEPDEAAPVAAEPEPKPAPKPAPKVAKMPAPEKTRSKKAEAKKPIAQKTATGGGSSEASISNQTIRVNVDLLEGLMNMVSELVLTRNQLMQMVRRVENSEFTVPLQRLSQCTTELQEGVMKTRMQPIGNAWAKLPRIVRDLCHELGKKIDLQMIGADTELDRQVLELIKDPLTHMVRNSGDHGVELPEERVAAGKPETGRITLNAYHEGGHINIEISDDGKGLNLERIREKALQNGVASEAELAEMTDQQVQRLIFHAGLSTAEKVTAVSGRGVGMDVVRSNIEKIGGTVDLKSVEGKGSTFIIKIPLTLAIVSALIVETAGERFAIPQISVVELVRASSDSEHRIENINKTPVLRLRDHLLPLVNLRNVLGMEEKPVAGSDGASSDDGADNVVNIRREKDAFVVVSQVGPMTFGIVVDRVFDTEEIVVKPTARIMRDLTVYSGNTILGDGSVIMILDPNGIAAKASDAMVNVSHAEDEKVAATKAGDDEKVSMLLFRAGEGSIKAVPLALVARLEEFDAQTIEWSDNRHVVQYRGALMPVIAANAGCPIRTEGRQSVLVFADERRSMGMAVEEIVDIVEEVFEVQLESTSPGIMGTAILNGQATEIIDVSYFLDQGFDDWFQNGDTGNGHNNHSVLLIDDSPFFRNMIKPLLSVAGYEVTTAKDAAEALEMRENGQHFDIIVSDIEMPDMDGFEFAQTIREEGQWATTPLVALSSHNTPEDFSRGREAGFSNYVVKLDRDALLQTLSETLQLEGDAA
jgi:two-component system chemotaxis sensor kinase CheA